LVSASRWKKELVYVRKHDRIIEKAHGGHGDEFIWEIPIRVEFQQTPKAGNSQQLAKRARG